MSIYFGLVGLSLVTVAAFSASASDPLFISGPDPDGTIEFPAYEIGSGAVMTQQITLENRSSNALVEMSVRVSCGCVRVLGVPKELAAGATATVIIKIDPTGENLTATGKPSIKQVRIMYRREGERRSARMTVARLRAKWAYTHPLRSEPEALSFTNLVRGEKISGEIRITTTGSATTHDFSVTDVSSSFPFLKTTTEGNLIRITGKVPEYFRPSRNPLIMVRARSGGIEMPVLYVPVVVAMRSPPIVASPREIPVFVRPSADGLDVMIRLISRDKIPFSIKSVSLLNGEQEVKKELSFQTLKRGRTGAVVSISVTIPEMEQNESWIQVVTDQEEVAPMRVRVINAYH